MKRLLPYIIAIVVAIVLAVLVYNTGNKKSSGKLNERVTLRQEDKIPYGMYAARNLLPGLFPGASVFYDSRSPGNWDSLTSTSYNQAVVIITKNLDADESELERLMYFAKQGNYVFIIAKSLSYDAINFFDLSYNELSIHTMIGKDDSLRVKLEPPFFHATNYFVYPGKRYESSFSSFDSAYSLVLGRNDNFKPNFIRLKTGNGAIFIHLAPLAFSNYFILHKNNISYFEEAFSVIPRHVEKIVWNEYYLTKPKAIPDQKKPNPFRVMMNYPALRWGLLTGLFFLFMNALLGSRRKQRMIPGFNKPTNDSLDFVKTLGRLYHDGRDHGNLAKKMGVYFLEHVRSTYKLPTHSLDEKFIEALHYKSGHPVDKVRDIISFINYIEHQPPITEHQLSDFHRHLELFYQNT